MPFALTGPTPPAWALRFGSADAEELRAGPGVGDIPTSRVIRGGQPVHYDCYSVTGRLTGVCEASASFAQALRGSVSAPVLHLGVPPGTVYRWGRRSLVPTQHASALLLPPDWVFTRSSPPGSILAVQVEHETLISELSARGALPRGPWTLRMQDLQPTAAERAQLEAAARAVLLATQPGAAARRLAHAEARLIDSIAGLILGRSAAAPGGHLARSRVADLEQWIDAHLEEPISLGRLCRVAGVGARSLQAVFESRRGVSPMRFVTERRIQAAHQRLSAAAAGASVTAVAADLGFTHLGRFAQLYRLTLGELPSHTLAQAAAGRAA